GPQGHDVDPISAVAQEDLAAAGNDVLGNDPGTRDNVVVAVEDADQVLLSDSEVTGDSDLATPTPPVDVADAQLLGEPESEDWVSHFIRLAGAVRGRPERAACVDEERTVAGHVARFQFLQLRPDGGPP